MPSLASTLQLDHGEVLGRLDVFRVKCPLFDLGLVLLLSKPLIRQLNVALPCVPSSLVGLV